MFHLFVLLCLLLVIVSYVESRNQDTQENFKALNNPYSTKFSGPFKKSKP